MPTWATWSPTRGDLLQPAALLPALDQATTAGDVEGLAAAGWTGDPRLARLGMGVTAAKWSWLVPATLKAASRARSHSTMYGGRWSVNTETLFAERTGMLAYFADLADEPDDLRSRLG